MTQEIKGEEQSRLLRAFATTGKGVTEASLNPARKGSTPLLSKLVNVAMAAIVAASVVMTPAPAAAASPQDVNPDLVGVLAGATALVGGAGLTAAAGAAVFGQHLASIMQDDILELNSRGISQMMNKINTNEAGYVVTYDAALWFSPNHPDYEKVVNFRAQFQVKMEIPTYYADGSLKGAIRVLLMNFENREPGSRETTTDTAVRISMYNMDYQRDMNGNYVYERDEAGNVKYGADGEPVKKFDGRTYEMLRDHKNRPLNVSLRDRKATERFFTEVNKMIYIQHLFDAYGPSARRQVDFVKSMGSDEFRNFYPAMEYFDRSGARYHFDARISQDQRHYNLRYNEHIPSYRNEVARGYR